MTTTTERAELNVPLMMRMPEGASLRVHGVDIAVTREEGDYVECRLTLEAPQDVYLSFAVRGIFHLAPDNRGEGAEDFMPRGPVRIEARLDPQFVPQVEALGGTATAVAESLRGASAARTWSPLLQTEVWYALQVSAELVAEEGGRTSYNTIFAAQEAGRAGPAGPFRPPLMGVVIDALEERAIEWAETTDDEVIEAEIRDESGTWSCFFIARESGNRVSVYSQAPWYTPEPVRGAMAELITRINYGLSIGNFEMDYSDGEVRFKTSVEVPADGPHREIVERIISPNLAAMNTYLPALEAVRDGRLTPAEALDSVEPRG